ncbi:acetyltransferase [Accumulibacter sp.]|uniref:acetyltransferase n=1 Tax=Accumulibacter sp. TaxID=2053492 RepID=UPI00262AD82B|nr:acetyltransferase [Accumulibacter sp.]MDS4053607.1 acetyltransferase [Accumulibacter sp.]
MKHLIAVYGASGCGREVMPLARHSARAASGDDDTIELVFVDDGYACGEVNGHRLLTYAQFLAEPAGRRSATLAIANSSVRERLAAQCVADGVEPFEVVAANACVLDCNAIGEGAILCGFTTVTSNVRIGRYFHANIYSSVAHDCVLGDFVTLAPSVKVNGNVVVEEHAYIGTGAIIKQGSPGNPLVIGKRAVIGMGAVVTKSVPAGATVVGNPARIRE